MTNYFWEHLLKWYKVNKREFPWRRTDNPYYIIIAEILLQQTNVRKVTPVYKKIINIYETPEFLAAADIDDLEEIIKPLGLIYRAQRLIKIAEILVNRYNSKVPSNKKELKLLPGVGDYIADAVLCYGYHKKTIPIDTNVIRVFSRYYNLKSNYSRSRNDKGLLTKIRSLYNFEDYKDSNLAVLDFASKVCKAKKPRCNICCLNDNCRYFNDKGDNSE